jgi:plastocyanin
VLDRRAVRWIGLVVVALLAVACGDPDPDRVPGPTLIENAEPDIVAEVDITSGGFDPDEVTLEARQAISLTNATDENVRAVGRADGDRRYDTGPMEPGETTVVAFDRADTYEFTLEGADEPGLVVAVDPTPTTS